MSPAGVELHKPTHFTVTTKGAGKANLDCNFSAPIKAEAVKDFEIINNHDNTHTVKYTPVQQVRREKQLALRLCCVLPHKVTPLSTCLLDALCDLSFPFCPRDLWELL